MPPAPEQLHEPAIRIHASPLFMRGVTEVSTYMNSNVAHNLPLDSSLTEQDSASSSMGQQSCPKGFRRRYSAEYKLSILRQADFCTEPGSLASLLRREGLSPSNLTNWRRQREAGILEALKPRQRGRKAALPNPLALENMQLRRINARLAKRLKQAELILDAQKKVSQILGITLEAPPQKD